MKVLDIAEKTIQAAEFEFQNSSINNAKKIISNFLQSNPQQDQFYVKAKLIMAKIINIESANITGIACISEKKIAIAHVMTALDVSLSSENSYRYKFLVYNISLVLWEIINPLLRFKRAKYFLTEIQKMSNALEVINDLDKDWRILYLSATSFCLDDDKQNKMASDYVDKAIELSEKELSLILEEEFKLSESNKLINSETEKIMSAVRQREDWELSKFKKKKIDPDAPEEENSQEVEQINVEPLTGLASEPFDELNLMLQDIQNKKAKSEEKLKLTIESKIKRQESLYRLFMQRIQVNPSDSKSIQAKPNVDKSFRAKSLVQMQCILTGIIPEKDASAALDQLFSQLDGQPISPDIAETMLDLSKIAWSSNKRELAIKAYTKAESEKNLVPLQRCKLDYCKALHIISDLSFYNANEVLDQRLTTKQTEGYVIDRKIEAIKIIERIMTMLITRCDDNNFLQEVCIGIWNICFTFCQPHLRKYSLRVLQQASSALEKISSPLQFLRAQIYFEISKTEEQNDFVLKALEEGRKAIHSDYGELDPSNTVKDDAEDLDRFRVLDKNILPFVDLLRLRTDVYGSPSLIEDQVLLLIQQAKESNSKHFQIDILTKATVKMLRVFEIGPGVVERSDSDSSLSSVSKSQSFSVPEISLVDIESVLSTARTNVKYTVFKSSLQKALSILATIIKMAHTHRNFIIIQKLSTIILSFAWDENDVQIREFLFTQSDVCFILADSLVERLSKLNLSPEQEENKERDTEEESQQDPRVLGVLSKYATDDMNMIKKLITKSIQLGVNISLSIKDEYGYQNGAIYFWNLHMHVFRKDKYHKVLPETSDLLKNIYDALESFKTSNGAYIIDEKLRVFYIEAISLYYSRTGQIQLAFDTVSKASTNGTPYLRRKLCELIGFFAASSSIAGGNSAAAKGSKPIEPMKFDDPFLNVLCTLAQIETPGFPENLWEPLVAKAISYMTEDVPKRISSLNMKHLSQEDFDQVTELQCECWTRLTRIKLRMNDVYGSQAAAESCLQIVADNNMLGSDIRQLSPRVWRWVSACERYFGITLSNLIKEEGQDVKLQNELRLASLRHFNLSCQFGQKSGKENLIVAGASNAWNVSFAMVSDSSVSKSLMNLYKQILSNLNFCASNSKVGEIKLQFYSAIIDMYTQDYQWDLAAEVILEAFEKVPTEYHKPLWQRRIIVMSKRGKNILDAIQKLKEGDVSLQARVYAILARASSNPKQQAEAFYKAIDVLKDDPRKISYILETVQWMSSSGLPKKTISMLIQSSLDTIYEIEEAAFMLEPDDENKNDDDTLSKTGSKKSSTSKKSSSTRQNTAKSSVRPGTQNKSKPPSRTGTSGSVRSAKSSSSKKPGDNSSSVADDENDEFRKISVMICDLAIRANGMKAILESNSEKKIQKCLEICHYITKSKQIWIESVRFYYKTSAYDKLTSSERETTPFDTFTVEYPKDFDIPSISLEPNFINSLDLVEDSDTLGLWNPPLSLLEISQSMSKAIATAASSSAPLFVPSSESIAAFPMTVYYTLWASDCLVANGYPQKALMCISWIRLLIIILNIKDPDIIVLVFYKLNKILYGLGFDKLAESLSKNDFIGVRISEYIKGILSQSKQEILKTQPLIPPNEELAKYGFFTWTFPVDGIKSLYCPLEVAEYMLQAGNFEVAYFISTKLLESYYSSVDNYGVLKSSLIIAQIDIFNGSYDKALTLLLACQSAINQLGHAKMLMSYAQLLIECYSKTNRINDGIDSANQSLELIRPFVSFSVVNQDNQSTKATSSKSRDIEVSYENMEAYATILFCKIKLQMKCIHSNLENGKVEDIILSMNSIETSLNEAFEMSNSTHGSNSILSASILEFNSNSLFSIVKCIQTSSSFILPIEEQDPWRDRILERCISYLKESIDILTTIKANIDETEQIPFVIEKSDTTQGKLPTAINISLTRNYLDLSYQFAYIAHFEKSNFASELSTEDLSIVDKYLLESKPEEPLVTSDFISSHRLSALHYSNSSFSLSPSTKLSLAAEINISVCNLYHLNKSSSESQFLVEDHMNRLNGLIPVSIYSGYVDSFLQACSSIVDVQGSTDLLSTANYLFWMQSFQAKAWLCDLWKSALNPVCEIARALSRYELLNDHPAHSQLTLARLKAELSFLETNSSQFRRLNISSHPKDILSKIPIDVHIFSIQFNIEMTCLYFLVKMPGELSKESFIFQKISIDEFTRRKIFDLISKHNIWVQKTIRVVSNFGDSMTTGHEITGNNFNYLDKNAEKQESSLENKIKDLIIEFQDLFSSALNPSSPIGKYSEQLLLSKSESKCILFIDPKLQDIPWEGFAIFDCFNKKLSRDFSLHFLHHRLSAANVYSNSLPTSTIKYAVDPFLEDMGQDGMKNCFEELKKANNLISKWLPIGDNLSPLCLLDWVKISDSNLKPLGIYINSLGRLGSLISPRELSTLNYEKVHFALIADNSYNFTSFRRQESSDNLKEIHDIQCENPIKMVALLSLSGVNSIVSYRWTTSISSQKTFVNNFLNNMTNQKLDVINSFSQSSKVKAVDVASTLTLKIWINLAKVVYGIQDLNFKPE